MKRLSRILIISIVCMTVVTVSYINAEYSFINPDGTGCVFNFESNAQSSANVYVYVDEWTATNWIGLSYVKKFEHAEFSTSETDLMGETNTGAYFLNIGNPFIDGPKNGNYTGAEYDDLSESMDVWNSSPHGVSSYASAKVDPDYDDDAGPISVNM